MRFKALPVTSLEDITLDLEQLSTRAILDSTPSSFLQLLTAGTLKVNVGQASLSWGGASTVSSASTITHSLGRTPTFIGLSTNLTSVNGRPNFPNWLSGVTTTQFQALSTATATPAAGETATLTWVVIG